VFLSPGLAALGLLPCLAMDINRAKGIALIFFFGFFLILLLRLLLGSKANFSKRAEIPLHDHQVVEPREQPRHE
jgi:cbb3-type cytochrome oxidase subunit 3